MKKYLLWLVSTILHLAAGAVIYYFWQPIVQWYWQYRPILGIDFYNFASYVGYLSRHFAFRFNGWKYIWYGGQPLIFDYPTLHAYLVLPLLNSGILSLPQTIQVYMLGACFLFLFFSYLLFAEISKDRFLALVLTIASSFSIGIYGALVWGGSLPYFATQLFLPLTLWALVKSLGGRTSREVRPLQEKWFYLSSLFLGVSFLGHPQVGFSYLVPISFLLLFFFPLEGEKYLSWVRIKRVALYFSAAVLIGYSQLNLYLGQKPWQIFSLLPRRLITVLGGFFKTSGKLVTHKKDTVTPFIRQQATSDEAAAEIAQYYRQQLNRFLTDSNKLFFTLSAAALIIFIISFLVRRKRKNSLKAIVFVLPALWVIFYGYLFAMGLNFFHGGWYRVFWPFPLVLGMSISFIWGDFWQSIKERLGKLGQKPAFNFTTIIISGVIAFFLGALLLQGEPVAEMLEKIETPTLRQHTSAFPDSLGVYIEKEELEKLKRKLTPSWLDPNETNYRLYEADQRVNIWWSALFDMPLVKGYVDPPAGDSSGGFYWTSVALSRTGGSIDSLIESWGVPREMAYNNALFLIDWYSIKYIEAEHEPSDSYNPPTSYLAESDIFARKEKVTVPGRTQFYMIDDGQPILWHPDEKEYLTYYELKNDFVSPIAHSTNASTLGVIAAPDAYRTILRNLAAVNLNSRRVVPIKLSRVIDNISYQDLKKMDAVILYAYDYRNHSKAWDKLEKYVREGGKVLIETGSEVKQTDSINLPAKYSRQLPDLFPIKMTKQEEMGKRWDLKGEKVERVDFKAFGPPILNGKPWLFSQPNLAEDLKEGARVILSNQGVPLVVSWSYGKGEVVWSGMNLPYHITVHKNLEEARFFKNLVENFINLEPIDYSGYEVERQSASKIIIKGAQARGVFFREQHFRGWHAKVNGREAPIYWGGPTYPGFMYVVIPQEARGSPFQVTFSYRGEFWHYFWPGVSLVVILLILDRSLFNSRLIIPWVKKISDPLKKRARGWWEKEEEY